MDEEEASHRLIQPRKRSCVPVAAVPKRNSNIAALGVFFNDSFTVLAERTFFFSFLYLPIAFSLPPPINVSTNEGPKSGARKKPLKKFNLKCTLYKTNKQRAMVLSGRKTDVKSNIHKLIELQKEELCVIWPWHRTCPFGVPHILPLPKASEAPPAASFGTEI